MPDMATAQAELLREAAPGAPLVAKMGQVVSRSPGTLAGGAAADVMVAFDGGSGTAQPVKCFESVIVAEGDSVGLVKFQDDWIIVGNYTLRTLADAATILEWGSVANTTSATFVDMPSSPTVDLTKRRDATVLRVEVSLSLWVATSAPTVFELAVYVASGDGSVGYDEILFHRAMNATSDHRDWTGWTTTAALHGDDTYAVTARWRRVSGTGTLTVDTNDSISMSVREVVS